MKPGHQTAEYAKRQSLHRWPQKIRGSAVVRQFFDLLQASPHTMTSLSKEAGLGLGTIPNWSRDRMPTLFQFEMALNTLGYKLAIVPIDTPEVPT